MNRQQIKEIIAKEIFPQISIHAQGVMDWREIMKIIIDWRRQNGFPAVMVATVDDGFLSLNGYPVERIAGKLPKMQISKLAAYYEGKCIRTLDEYDF